MLTTCFYLFCFFKKLKEIWNQPSCFIFSMIFEEKYLSYYIPLTDKFRRLTAFTSWDNGQLVKANEVKYDMFFYNDLVSKISKIHIVWLWGNFFYLNKLQTRLFSWNISVTDVNECRKLCFLFLFITKYFITIHIYQIVLSPLVYYIYFDEPVCKLHILK